MNPCDAIHGVLPQLMSFISGAGCPVQQRPPIRHFPLGMG
nr:K173 [uncultured bacterium]